MEKRVWLEWLMDVYGSLLTDRQNRALSLYLSEDLSLAEIAQGEGISRQGVHDAIQRAEEALRETEAKLGLAEKQLRLIDRLEALYADLIQAGQTDFALRVKQLLADWGAE